MEFAVIKTGGKQYNVSTGDSILVEKLPEVVAGDKIVLGEVIMYSKDGSVITGDSCLKVTVDASVTEQLRAKKIIIFKKKRRQNYRRKNGFRRHLTRLTIDGISLSS